MKYQRGDKVFFVRKPKSPFDLADSEGLVEHSFIGEDGEEHIVVKYYEKDAVMYALHTYNSLYSAIGSKSNMLDRIKNDEGFAKKILIRAKIYNEDGTLRIAYGGEYDLIDGVKVYDDDEQ